MDNKRFEQFARRLGTVIRSTREERDLTQKELADAAGVSMKYLSMMETGETNPSIKTFTKVCTALKVRPTELMDQAKLSQLKNKDPLAEKLALLDDQWTRKFLKILSRLTGSQKRALMAMAQEIAS